MVFVHRDCGIVSHGGWGEEEGGKFENMLNADGQSHLPANWHNRPGSLHSGCADNSGSKHLGKS
jgi:hypothetical protein